MEIVVTLSVLYVATLSVGVFLYRDSRVRRPKSTEELETVVSQLRLRVAEMEDRLERLVKRRAVQEYRARETNEGTPEATTLSRAERLAELNARIHRSRKE